jgi:hypothetical protein
MNVSLTTPERIKVLLVDLYKDKVKEIKLDLLYGFYLKFKYRVTIE